VGFRPFVYRLAHEQGLAGFIGNDTDGVTIEVEGPAEQVKTFLARLLRAMLEVEDFDAFQHSRVSPGDGRLSYGQAGVAAARLAKSELA
jgi:hydrogenase maturation protein HypF